MADNGIERLGMEALDAGPLDRAPRSFLPIDATIIQNEILQVSEDFEDFEASWPVR